MVTRGRTVHANHGVIRGGKNLCAQLEALPEVADCNTGIIRGKSSFERGVRLLKRNYDVQVDLHAENGRQFFYIKPSEGTTLENLLTVVTSQVRKNFTILERKEDKQMKVKDPNKEELIDKAYQFLLERSGDYAGERRVSGVSHLLKKELGLAADVAARVHTTLVDRGILIAVGQTAGSGRPTTIYRVKPIEPAEPVPPVEQRAPLAGEPTPTKSAAASDEMLRAIESAPGLVREALDCLWVVRTEKAETIGKELAGLREQEKTLAKRIAETEKKHSESVALVRDVEDLIERSKP